MCNILVKNTFSYFVTDTTIRLYDQSSHIKIWTWKKRLLGSALVPLANHAGESNI